jgi:hypothetical protein
MQEAFRKRRTYVICGRQDCLFFSLPTMRLFNLLDNLTILEPGLEVAHLFHLLAERFVFGDDGRGCLKDEFKAC